jgi:hypothetical protein
MFAYLGNSESSVNFESQNNCIAAFCKSAIRSSNGNAPQATKNSNARLELWKDSCGSVG